MQVITNRVPGAHGGYNYPLRLVRDFSPKAKNGGGLNGLKGGYLGALPQTPEFFPGILRCSMVRILALNNWAIPNLAKQVGGTISRLRLPPYP